MLPTRQQVLDGLAAGCELLWMWFWKAAGFITLIGTLIGLPLFIIGRLTWEGYQAWGAWVIAVPFIVIAALLVLYSIGRIGIYKGWAIPISDTEARKQKDREKTQLAHARTAGYDSWDDYECAVLGAAKEVA